MYAVIYTWGDNIPSKFNRTDECLLKVFKDKAAAIMYLGDALAGCSIGTKLLIADLARFKFTTGKLYAVEHDEDGVGVGFMVVKVNKDQNEYKVTNG